MSNCHLAKQCTFFARREEGGEMREYFTAFYCAENFSECARYKTALDLGMELVQDDIFPNENNFLSLFAWALTQRESSSAHFIAENSVPASS